MASSENVTVLFCDVVGSTERLVRVGDIAADEHRRELFGALTAAVRTNDGVVVKHLGDGLMVVFPTSAMRALSCAADLHRAARSVEPDDPVRLRVGISAGEVTHEHDDWFGLPVVEAARLCAAASPDQTLANAVVRHLVGSRAVEHRLTDVGDVALKGLAAPLATVSVDWPHGDDPRPASPLVTASGSLAGPAGPSDRPASDAVPLNAPLPPPVPVRRRRRTSLALATVVVLALVSIGLALGARDERPEISDEAGADTPNSDRATTSAPPMPRGYEPILRAVECTPEITDAAPDSVCRELVVPESRANPDGPKVAVPVTSRYAVDPIADPVVLVDVNEPVATTSLNEVADVHALGLRGFAPGGRPELDCPELRTAWSDSLALRADDPAARQQRVDAASACAERLRAEKVQLEGYSMREVADDIRDLVIADRLAPVNIAGGGFATVALTTYARNATDAVSALVLTNPISPGSSSLGDPVHSLEESFSRLVDQCSESDDCAAQHPDLGGSYEERFAELDARPVVVTTPSLVGTGPHRVLLDGRRWAAALEAALYPSDRLGLVPEAIDGASAELTASTGIDEDVRFFVAPASRAGATLSYMCSYDADPNRTAEISAGASPEFAGANETSFAPMCDAWDVPSRYDHLSGPLVGDVPVLIAQGGISVSGVNHWGDEMAAQLDDATLLRFPTLSADLAYSPPPCLRQLRNEFIVDHDIRDDVSSCEEQSPEIEFVGG